MLQGKSDTTIAFLRLYWSGFMVFSSFLLHEWYNAIFIYCSWVSTRWQWSLRVYSENKSKNTQNRKQHV